MKQLRKVAGVAVGMLALSAGSASAALVVTIDDILSGGSLSCTDNDSCDLDTDTGVVLTTPGAISPGTTLFGGMSTTINVAFSDKPHADLLIDTDNRSSVGAGYIRVTAEDDGYTTTGPLAIMGATLDSSAVNVKSKHGAQIAGTALPDVEPGPTAADDPALQGESTKALGPLPPTYSMIASVEIDHRTASIANGGSTVSSATSTSVSVVPVPAAGLLMLGGLGMMLGLRRRKSAA